MGSKTSTHATRHLSLWEGLGGLLFLLLFAVSCSESDEVTDNEFSNWQARNEAYFATLEDSLSRGGSAWKKIKLFTKDEKTATTNADYIYIKVLEQGDGTMSPLYTDSVRVSYRGRLIPTTNHPQGYVFDETYEGNYSRSTTGIVDNKVSNFRDGFATALQHMHLDDRWRIYIPYQLGYGTSDYLNIPAYSVMIFDVALIDFVTGSESLEPWASRRW